MKSNDNYGEGIVDTDQLREINKLEVMDRLEEITKKIHIKTFLNLRNIIKPHIVVLLCA
jgi:hypothetical protein